MVRDTQRVDTSPVDDGKVNLDRILVEEVGQCGRYQVRVIALCCLVGGLQGLARNDYIFTFSKVGTRCVIPECENASSANLDFNPPWISNALPPSHNSFDNCHRYGSTTANISDSCPADIFDRGSIIQCEQYVYENKNSAVYDFSMACEAWRPNLVGSVSIFGMMISMPLAGFAADHWGRKVTMIVSGINLAWIGCLKYFASTYINYLLLSFTQSVTGAYAFTCAIILAIEFVGPKYRVVAGASINTCIALGDTLKGFLAWAVPSWRHLILILEAPMFIIVSYLWIAPESIRWLLDKGRYAEAKKILEEAAKMNGNVLSERTLHDFSVINDTINMKKDGSEPWLVGLVFKHKKILLRCILTPIWWITIIFIYYGLSMSSVGVVGNKYLNYSAVSAVAILGYWTTVLLLNRIGRKPLLIAGYWICGTCQIVYIFMPDGHYWLSLSVYLVGKLTISTVLSANYIYTAELYPTRYRSRLMSYSSMMGRMGGILAPLTPALSDVIWRHLPFALFAGMAFLSGLLVMVAPETLGATLPDSMEDAENLGRDKSRIRQPQRENVTKYDDSSDSTLLNYVSTKIITDS